MLRNVRVLLDDAGRQRYFHAVAAVPGETDGSSIAASVSTSQAIGLSDFEDDHFNDCEALILDPDVGLVGEGQVRLVEDFTSGVLYFTNNPFPGRIREGAEFELFERGSFSGVALKRHIIDGINFLAQVLPKDLLFDYIITEAVSGTSGVADPPSSCLDVHLIKIDGKPAIPIPPERRYRLTSGVDVYLSQSTTNRYLYYLEGQDGSNSQLRYAPPATL